MVFYADDDLDDIMIFNEAMAQFGQPAMTFENGDLLLEKLKNPPPGPSIVFLDINMPKKSGLKVLQEIRQEMQLESVPVVMLTTSPDAAMIEKSFAYGANYYITKAVKYSEFLASIKHAITTDWRQFQSNLNNFVHQY